MERDAVANALNAIQDFILSAINPTTLIKLMDGKQPEDCLVKLKDELRYFCNDVYGCLFLTDAYFPSKRKRQKCDSKLNLLLEVVLYYLYESECNTRIYRRFLNVFYNKVCYEIEELLLLLDETSHPRPRVMQANGIGDVAAIPR